MKKALLSFLGIGLLAPMVFAGGIVTNTNQSTGWVRSLARDAVISPDGVYYNPAGVVRLADGFYFDISNQSVLQAKTVTNEYPYLNNHKYVGDVLVPFFPTAYAIYKKGNWAFHGGFTVVGGGGSADYDKGLASFEIPIASLPATLTALKIPTTAYSADINFSGSSSYMGLQVGASYKINDFIAVGLGMRYIMAKNTYTGSIRNIMFNPTYQAFGAKYDGSMVLASDFFTDGGNTLTALSTYSTQMATGLGMIVAGGGGSLLLSQGTAAGLTATQIAQAQQLIGAAGMDPSNMTIQQAQAVLTAAAPAFLAKGNAMYDNADATSDIEVDTDQTGNAITPIISVDLSLLDGNLGVAMKYENKTPLEITNETRIDGSGLFANGVVSPSEMPSLLSLGVRYKATDRLQTLFGAHYFFDKGAKYGKKDKITGDYVTNGSIVTLSDGTTGSYLSGNSYELSAGVEYNLTKKIMISAGYLFSCTSPNPAYQTDMSYTLVSSSLGIGGVIHIKDRLDLNLGVSGTLYNDYEKTVNYPNPANPATTIAVKELYQRTNYIFSIGLGYHFGE